jgi:hypothetical protein
MSWTIPVPVVKNGDPVNAYSVNKGNVTLGERTAILKALLDAIEAGQNIVLRNVPVDATTLPGHVVYYNDTTKLHDKALALWTPLGVVGYTAVPADSAVYSGIIVSKASDYLADVLLEGVAVLDNTALTRLFDSVTPTAGVYFLSNSVAGTVTATKPAMSVRTLEYMDAGAIRVFAPSHEPITHTHLNYTLLDADWLAAGAFADPPPSATFGYDFTSVNAIDSNLAEALLVGAGGASFIDKATGLHLFEADIFIDETGIWWTAVGAPANEIELNLLTADVKDMSLVHTILSKTPAVLEVINNNGRVVLTINPYGTETVAATGTAVIGINSTDHKLQLAPVLTSAVAGAGISVTVGLTGQVTIGSALYNNLPVLPHIINLNNAVTSVEGSHVITQFPVGRTSSIACSCALPNMSDGTYAARIWVQVLSPVASQPAPALAYSLIPTPDTAGVTPGASTVIALPALPGSVSSGDVYYIETANISLTGAAKGLLNYTLSDTPADPFKIIATGIILIQL